MKPYLKQALVLALGLSFAVFSCSEAKTLKVINAKVSSEKKIEKSSNKTTKIIPLTRNKWKKKKISTNKIKEKANVNNSSNTIVVVKEGENKIIEKDDFSKNAKGPKVRVFLQYAPSNRTKIVPDSKVKIINANGKVWKELPANRDISVELKHGKVYVDNHKFDEKVTVESVDGFVSKIIAFNRSYRGNLIFTNQVSKNNLAVINAVPMEYYLYGVVPKEVVPSWPKAALEAQAVAARTYAYNAMTHTAGKVYDVESDTRSQVYQGADDEFQTTTNAVQSTNGLIMTYDGKPIDAVFHSDGGGYTENSENVWNQEMPYLRAVPETDRNERASYVWTVKTDKRDIESKLKAAGKDVGDIKEIKLSPLAKRPMKVDDRGPSGRIISAIIIGSKRKIEISGSTLKAIFGLKSSCFDFYVDHKPENNIINSKKVKAYHKFKHGNQTVYIHGYGWGHGLGLSQWGAADMAKAHKGNAKNYFKEILRHYYQGVNIEKIY